MYPLLPQAEVARRYDVTSRTVRNWVNKGLIVGYKRNGHSIWIDERSLDNLLTPIKRGAK